MSPWEISFSPFSPRCTFVIVFRLTFHYCYLSFPVHYPTWIKTFGMPLARRVEREIYDRPVRERVNNRNIEEKILASLFLSIAFIRLCFYHSSAFCKQKVRGLFCSVMNGLVKFLYLVSVSEWLFWFFCLRLVICWFELYCIFLTIQYCSDSTWVLWMADKVICHQLATPPYLRIVLNVF